MNIKNLIAVAAITASAMVSTHSFADTNITENVTLTADTDWSGLGLVTIESGVTVELSGCKLSLDGLAGEGSVVTTAVVGEDLLEGPQPDPGIDQDGLSPGFQIITVSAAAGKQLHFRRKNVCKL